MSKMKQKYTLSRIKDIYSKIFLKEYKEKNIEEYISDKFGDSKLTYSEFKKQQLKYESECRKINANNYYIIKNKISEKANEKYNQIVHMYYDKTTDKLLKKQLNIFNISKEKYYTDFYGWTVKSYNDYLLSPLRYQKNHTINSDALKEYIAEYYNSKEEFIVDILLEEISFLHEFKIFGNELMEISKNIGYSNSRQFTVLVNCLSTIYKNRFYANPWDKLNSKFKGIIISKLKNAEIAFDGSTSNILTNIIENFTDLSYDNKKDIIFAYANRCTSIIAGNVTLESYNLPFRHVLNKDDYEELLNFVYVGNNSIKIYRKETK